MEIDIEGNLRIKLNEKNKTASVIISPKATGIVFIPRFVEYENQQYKIISINERAFENCDIEFLTFPEDSEVETFEKHMLYNSHIKKLKIPPLLINLRNDWNNIISDLNEIEISPKNKNFTFYNNDFLLEKSLTKNNSFDILHYARCNIEEATIPPQVKIIKRRAFDNHKVKSITFPANSELEYIENFAFTNSTMKKLVLPASIRQIGDYGFSNTNNLNEVEISPQNKFFSVFENKYILKKSDQNSDIYDILIFGFRDLKEATIPSFIKVINDCAFYHCQYLKSIQFESNSSLEMIKSFAFSDILGEEKMVFPPSLNRLEGNSLGHIKNVKYIEFLGQKVQIGSQCFTGCNLISISFPNADQLKTNSSHSLFGIPKETKILVRKEAKLLGDGAEQCINYISYLDENTSTKEMKNEKKSITKEIKSDKNVLKERNTKHETNNKEDLERYFSYLQSHFGKYEGFLSFDKFIKDGYQIDTKFTKDTKNENNFLIGPDDEKHQKVICKIGEGATSEVFKVIDTRTGKVICKKNH